MNAAPIVRVRVSDLCVSYPSSLHPIEALKDVSIEIYQDEILCVMGPSGCGKTTLLKVIAGLLAPTSGTVELDGKPVISPGPDRAVVFQADAVFPWMTVEDNAGYAPRLAGRSRAERAEIVERSLQLVGLQEFRHAWPKELSGGMKKRVDLARAFAAEPELLLMDEPFGALDLITKEQLQVELERLWATQRRTALFVTHDLEEALFLGDRIVVMTPRPARVAAVEEVRFARPRASTLKTEPEFVALRRRLRALLAEHLKGNSPTADEIDLE